MSFQKAIYYYFFLKHEHECDGLKKITVVLLLTLPKKIDQDSYLKEILSILKPTLSANK